MEWIIIGPVKGDRIWSYPSLKVDGLPTCIASLECPLHRTGSSIARQEAGVDVERTEPVAPTI